MAKKRKSENAALDEVERTLYTSFCTAANSISQLYTQAQNQQRIAFQAGERQGVERLYNWLLREHQNGSNITVAQIIQNLQSELEGGSGDEMTMSPQQHQHQPSVVGPSGRTGALPALIDQGKISVFQGALSSPNRRSLPAFSGYTFVQQQPARSRGTIEQPSTDLREDELESAPYEAAAPPAAFGFPPPQSQQHQQRPGAPPQSFNEPDASMDMNEHGVPEDHYYR